MAKLEDYHDDDDIREALVWIRGDLKMLLENKVPTRTWRALLLRMYNKAQKALNTNETQ